jgi:hypothetical protein
VTKTIEVEAVTEDEAIKLAHDSFCVAHTEDPEDYSEEHLSVEKVKD